MALEFPDNPQVGESVTQGDYVYEWNGVGWKLVGGGSAANLVYSYPGSGVTRTVSDKLQEIPSVADFGAVGDGNVANTAVNDAAFQKAIDTIRPVFDVPASIN